MIKIGSLFTAEDKARVFATVLRVRRQIPAFLFLIAVVMCIYYASIHIPPG